MIPALATTPLARAVAWTFGAVVVGNVALAVLGTGPNVALLAAAGTLAGALAWFLAGAVERARVTGGVPAPPAAEPVARLDHRLMTMRNRIAYGRAEDVSTERLRATLVDVIDDQLVAVHEIDRAVDPAAAAAVLGPELTAFVDDAHAARRLTRARDLDRLVTLIERL